MLLSGLPKTTGLSYSTIRRSFPNKDRLEQPVAIKILVSELGREHQEVDLYHRLASGRACQPGRVNMPELFDSFELHGSNGVHQCLVMELLGQSMASLA